MASDFLRVPGNNSEQRAIHILDHMLLEGVNADFQDAAHSILLVYCFCIPAAVKWARKSHFGMSIQKLRPLIRNDQSM